MWLFKKKVVKPWYDDHTYGSNKIPKDKFVVVYWSATDELDGIVTIDTTNNTVLISTNHGTYLNKDLAKVTVFET